MTCEKPRLNAFKQLPEDIQGYLRLITDSDSEYPEVESAEEAERIVRRIADYFNAKVTDDCGFIQTQINYLPFQKPYKTGSGVHYTRVARVRSPHRAAQGGGFERTAILHIQFVRYTPR